MTTRGSVTESCGTGSLNRTPWERVQTYRETSIYAPCCGRWAREVHRIGADPDDSRRDHAGTLIPVDKGPTGYSPASDANRPPVHTPA